VLIAIAGCAALARRGAFVDERRVGGLDADGNIVADRTEASTEVIRRAYRNGIVLTGGGGLAETPIIDWRRYADDLSDNHDSFRSFVTRARLIAADRNAGNQVILIDSRGAPFLMALERAADPNPDTSLIARREREFVEEMDRWLDNVAADQGPGMRAEKVIRDKPSEVVDTCWTTDGEKVTGSAAYGVTGRCSQVYPQHGDPRIAAGGPMTDNTLKCELKAVSSADYSHPLTADQMKRLKAVFPSGVCDYSRPGVGQEMTNTTWQQY